MSDASNPNPDNGQDVIQPETNKETATSTTGDRANEEPIDLEKSDLQAAKQNSNPSNIGDKNNTSDDTKIPVSNPTDGGDDGGDLAEDGQEDGASAVGVGPKLHSQLPNGKFEKGEVHPGTKEIYQQIATQILDRDARITVIAIRNRTTRPAEQIAGLVSCTRYFLYNINMAKGDPVERVAEHAEKLDRNKGPSCHVIQIDSGRASADLKPLIDTPLSAAKKAQLAQLDTRLIIALHLNDGQTTRELRNHDSAFVLPWGGYWLWELCKKQDHDLSDYDAIIDQLIHATDWGLTRNSDIALYFELTRLLEEQPMMPPIAMSAKIKSVIEQSETADLGEVEKRRLLSILRHSDDTEFCGPIGAVMVMVATYAGALHVDDFNDLCSQLLPEGTASLNALPEHEKEKYWKNKEEAERLEQPTPALPSWRELYPLVCDRIRSNVHVVINADNAVELHTSWRKLDMPQEIYENATSALKSLFMRVSESHLISSMHINNAARACDLMLGIRSVYGRAQLERGLASAFNFKYLSLEFAEHEFGLKIEEEKFNDDVGKLLYKLLNKEITLDEFAALAPRIQISQERLKSKRNTSDHIKRATLYRCAQILSYISDVCANDPNDDTVAARLLHYMWEASPRDGSAGIDTIIELNAALLCIIDPSRAYAHAKFLLDTFVSGLDPNGTQYDRSRTLFITMFWLKEGLLFNRNNSPEDWLPAEGWLIGFNQVASESEHRFAGALRTLVFDEFAAKFMAVAHRGLDKDRKAWLAEFTLGRDYESEMWRIWDGSSVNVFGTGTLADLLIQHQMALSPRQWVDDMAVISGITASDQDDAESHRFIWLASRFQERIREIVKAILGGVDEDHYPDIETDARAEIWVRLVWGLNLPGRPSMGKAGGEFAKSFSQGNDLQLQGWLKVLRLYQAAVIGELRFRKFGTDPIKRGSEEHTRFKELLFSIAHKNPEGVIELHEALELMASVLEMVRDRYKAREYYEFYQSKLDCYTSLAKFVLTLRPTAVTMDS